MIELSNNISFLILVFIFISYVIVEKYISNHHLLATILVIIILYLFYDYLKSKEKKEQENLDTFNIFFNVKKYPFIYKNKEIYYIFLDLSFLTKYNEVSFQDACFYMNEFLKVIYNLDSTLFLQESNSRVNISQKIEKYIQYSRESTNILRSLVINIKDDYGIFKSDSNIKTKVYYPSIEVLEKNINKLIDIVNEIKGVLINRVNEKNKENVNIYCGFLNDVDAPVDNPLNTPNYMPNFNLD